MINNTALTDRDIRILLTDDDPRMLDSLQSLLELHNFNVDTALGGKEGIHKIASGIYDILLLDLKMPEVDGHDVMEYIRNQHIDILTIVVSGETSLTDIGKALRHGAYDYLKKPYIPEELASTVSNAVKKRLLEKSHTSIQSQLDQSEKLHRFIVNNSPDIIFILDSNGNISFLNSQTENLLGIPRASLMGKPINELFGNNKKMLFFFNRALSPHSSTMTMEFSINSLNDNYQRHFEITVWSITENDECSLINNETFHVYGTARDITERKEAEAFINFQAYHDLLTRLPNRSLFKDRLSTAISFAERQQNKLAVMFIDLDRFKIVNDSLGHTMGDRLLQAVSQRLQEQIRKSDTLSRFGGDEFTLLLPEITNTEAAVQIAEKILDSLKESFPIAGHNLFVGASIGIAMYPEAGTTMEMLIRNSDIAMYHVKNTGKDGFSIYDPCLADNSSQRLTLEQDIRHALEFGEFEVCYQPQVDAETLAIKGVEALIRWNHPTMGRLSPLEFIPIAEESRLIIEIDKQTLHKGCQEVLYHQKNGMPHLRLAVNLSPVMIERENFVEIIRTILEEESFPSTSLELEITESILMDDRQDIIDKLLQLTGMGVHLALDDFGTGYSSLSYLQKFPLTTLKIDRSFINNINNSHDEACIVNAIISMAHGLKMDIIAEGVENTEQLTYLKRLGCGTVQGFLFGAATSLETISDRYSQLEHTLQYQPLGAIS